MCIKLLSKDSLTRNISNGLHLDLFSENVAVAKMMCSKEMRLISYTYADGKKRN